MSGQKDRSWFVGYGEPAGRYVADDGGPLPTQPAPDPLLDQMAEALQKSRKHADDWRAEYSSAGIAADPELDSDIAEIDAALSAYDARRKP